MHRRRFLLVMGVKRRCGDDRKTACETGSEIGGETGGEVESGTEVLQERHVCSVAKGKTPTAGSFLGQNIQDEKILIMYYQGSGKDKKKRLRQPEAD